MVKVGIAMLYSFSGWSAAGESRTVPAPERRRGCLS